jgi:hypothetical protein
LISSGLSCSPAFGSSRLAAQRSGYAFGPINEHKFLRRVIFLETVAGIPGMVAGSLRHLRSLRNMERDNGCACLPSLLFSCRSPGCSFRPLAVGFIPSWRRRRMSACISSPLRSCPPPHFLPFVWSIFSSSRLVCFGWITQTVKQPNILFRGAVLVAQGVCPPSHHHTPSHLPTT